MTLYTCPYDEHINCDLTRPCKKCRIIDVTKTEKIRELQPYHTKEIKIETKGKIKVEKRKSKSNN